MGTKPVDDDAASGNTVDPLVQLRRLLSHLEDDELDLDAIDGEFYWRCCRRDVHIEAAKFAALITSINQEGIGTQPERIREQAEAVGNTINRLLNRFEPENPHIGRLLFQREGGTWTKLRDGRVISYPTGPKNPLGPIPIRGWEDRIELRVLSNRWTGADVEARIIAYVAGPDSGYGDWQKRPWLEAESSTESAVVRVAFAFAPAGSQSIGLALHVEPPTLALPHVIVTVAPPFPPPGTIATLYDDIVLRQRRWHERLAGIPTRQEKRVALRTWAIGLLVGAGRKTALAIREVSAILGEDEISQVQFTEDRHRLVERVPEAQPFLYAKPPRRAVAQNR
jgi:hypothetical protein